MMPFALRSKLNPFQQFDKAETLYHREVKKVKESSGSEKVFHETLANYHFSRMKKLLGEEPYIHASNRELFVVSKKVAEKTWGN